MKIGNSVIIPALNEATSIRSVVEFVRRSPQVHEVIVVDDGSLDGTPELALAAGAKVITSTLLGKGASMEDGVRESHGEHLLFLDGDLRALQPDMIERMLEPLEQGRADFVKACFSRQAGRVTTLTAKPLIQIFFPELVHFSQPLGGIIAAKRSLLETMRFETDYGVDLGLLIDVWARKAKIEEVSIGHLEHESQSLERLGDMAKQVVRTLLNRAQRFGRFSLHQFQEVEEMERHANAQLALSRAMDGAVERLAVFDMDGTLIDGRFVEALAAAIGKSAALLDWLDNSSIPPHERTEHIAMLFEGVPKTVFEEVARQMPLTQGAVETIIELRKAGYRVGVVTDSYLVAAEIVRRRVFADFSIANRLRFENGKSSGRCLPAPAWIHPQGCPVHKYCKRNVIEHWMERLGLPASRVLAVGDGLNDICMLQTAGLSFAFEPKQDQVASAAKNVVRGDLRQILNLALPHPA